MGRRTPPRDGYRKQRQRRVVGDRDRRRAYLPCRRPENWYARFLTDDYHGGLVYSPDFGIDIDPAKEEKRFLGELKDIRKLTDRFDVVMFPVDGRIGNGYTRGARQFLDVFRIGLFVPMHFVASGFESAWRMKEFTDAKSVPFWCIRREGECCEVKEIIAQASR